MFRNKPTGRRAARPATSPIPAAFAARSQRAPLAGHRWTVAPVATGAAKPWVRNGSLALAATGMITAVALSQVQPPTAGGNVATSLSESPTASTATDINFDGGTLRSAPGAEAGKDGKNNALLASAASSSSNQAAGLLGNSSTAGNGGPMVDATAGEAADAAPADGAVVASGSGSNNLGPRSGASGNGNISNFSNGNSEGNASNGNSEGDVSNGEGGSRAGDGQRSSGNGGQAAAGGQESVGGTPKPESTGTPTGEPSWEANGSPGSAALETMRAPDDASARTSTPEPTRGPEPARTSTPVSPIPTPTDDLDDGSNTAPTSAPVPGDGDTAPHGMTGSSDESAPADSDVDDAKASDDPASTAGTPLDPTSTLSKLLNPAAEPDEDDGHDEYDRTDHGTED